MAVIMENRTKIILEQDPGVLARALDEALFALGRPREHQFDGYVGVNGYDVSHARLHQYARPVVLRVEAQSDEGLIADGAYQNLVLALKECHEMPQRHPILVAYDPRLQITPWDLQLRVGGMQCLEARKAA